MIDHPFRSWLASRVNLLLTCYKALGLTPNGVTLLGCIFGFLAAIAVGMNHNWTALVLWWVGRLFDGTDGIYARATGRTSDFGGYLDIVCDMAAYSAMVWGFAVVRPEFLHWWIAMLFLYVLCITSALALGSLERREGLASGDNRSLRLAAGIAEGGETGICYTLLLVLPAASAWLCPAWCAVLATTIAARTLMARRELKR